MKLANHYLRKPSNQDENGYKRKYKEHQTYYLLNREPNKLMSRFTFMKVLVTSILLNGNGYAYIQRDNKGDAIQLTFVPAELVTVIRDNDMLKYNVVGIGVIESCNMIHILNFSYDGINGISTLTHARNTLGLATDIEAHASGIIKGGAN